MNSAWVPAIITVVGWIFTLGLTVGRINSQEKTLVEHDDRLNGQDVKLENHAAATATKLENHAIAIAKLEAWKEGYNAGVKKHDGARS